VLTAYLDGLDGSTKFKDTQGTARCGTMFSLYKGMNHRFEDYLCGGIVDHIKGQVVIAVKGKGVFVAKDDTVSPVTGSGRKALDPETRVYIDEGVKNYPSFPTHNQGYFYDPIKKAFKTRYLGSSAVYFFDLAVGDADLILEYGRKNNLEHMVGYPLVIESSGVMEFLAGGDLGPITYSDYCLINDGYPAIIVAASPELAQTVRILTSFVQ